MVLNDDLNKSHISPANFAHELHNRYWLEKMPEEKPKKLMVGPIIGGVVGGLALLWMIFLVWYLRRRRYLRSLKSINEKEQDGDSARVATTEGAFPTRDTFAAQEKHIEKIAEPKATVNRKSGVTSAFIIDTATQSPDSLDSEGYRKRPPTPPQKDEIYLRMMKRHSQPLMQRESPFADSTKRRQSSASLALEALYGPYNYRDYYQRNDDDSENGSDLRYPIPTYQQLLQHHQARKQRASYIDSAASSGENSTGTETATVGRVVSRGQVAKIRQVSGTPPNTMHANMLERRASVGRVVSPSQIMVPSRRSSRGSKDLLGAVRTRSIGGQSEHSDKSGSGGGGVGRSYLDEDSSLSGAATHSGGGVSSNRSSLILQGVTPGISHRRNRSLPLVPTVPRLPEGNNDSTNTNVYSLEDVTRDGIFARSGGIRFIRQVTPEEETEPPHRQASVDSKSSVDEAFSVSSSSSAALPRRANKHQRNSSLGGGEGITEQTSEHRVPSPVSPLSETATSAVQGRYSPLSPQ